MKLADYPTAKTSAKARVDPLTAAVQDFVLRVMEKPLTKRRIDAFFRRWSASQSEAFVKQLEMRVRLLLLMQDTPFPL
jgi:hypothetical protein